MIKYNLSKKVEDNFKNLPIKTLKNSNSDIDSWLDLSYHTLVKIAHIIKYEKVSTRTVTFFVRETGAKSLVLDDLGNFLRFEY